MKIMFKTTKYIFEVAGAQCFQYGVYLIPHHVYKRIIPFIYKKIGTWGFRTRHIEEDIQEWIMLNEGKKNEV